MRWSHFVKRGRLPGKRRRGRKSFYQRTPLANIAKLVWKSTKLLARACKEFVIATGGTGGLVLLAVVLVIFAAIAVLVSLSAYGVFSPDLPPAETTNSDQAVPDLAGSVPEAYEEIYEAQASQFNIPVEILVAWGDLATSHGRRSPYDCVDRIDPGSPAAWSKDFNARFNEGNRRNSEMWQMVAAANPGFLPGTQAVPAGIWEPYSGSCDGESGRRGYNASGWLYQMCPSVGIHRLAPDPPIAPVAYYELGRDSPLGRTDRDCEDPNYNGTYWTAPSDDLDVCDSAVPWDPICVHMGEDSVPQEDRVLCGPMLLSPALTRRSCAELQNPILSVRLVAEALSTSLDSYSFDYSSGRAGSDRCRYLENLRNYIKSGGCYQDPSAHPLTDNPEEGVKRGDYLRWTAARGVPHWGAVVDTALRSVSGAPGLQIGRTRCDTILGSSKEGVSWRAARPQREQISEFFRCFSRGFGSGSYWDARGAETSHNGSASGALASWLWARDIGEMASFWPLHIERNEGWYCGDFVSYFGLRLPLPPEVAIGSDGRDVRSRNLCSDILLKAQPDYQQTFGDDCYPKFEGLRAYTWEGSEPGYSDSGRTAFEAQRAALAISERGWAGLSILVNDPRLCVGVLPDGSSYRRHPVCRFQVGAVGGLEPPSVEKEDGVLTVTQRYRFTANIEVFQESGYCVPTGFPSGADDWMSGEWSGLMLFVGIEAETGAGLELETMPEDGFAELAYIACETIRNGEFQRFGLSERGEQGSAKVIPSTLRSLGLTLGDCRLDKSYTWIVCSDPPKEEDGEEEEADETDEGEEEVEEEPGETDDDEEEEEPSCSEETACADGACSITNIGGFIYPTFTAGPGQGLEIAGSQGNQIITAGRCLSIGETECPGFPVKTRDSNICPETDSDDTPLSSETAETPEPPEEITENQDETDACFVPRAIYNCQPPYIIYEAGDSPPNQCLTTQSIPFAAQGWNQPSPNPVTRNRRAVSRTESLFYIPPKAPDMLHAWPTQAPWREKLDLSLTHAVGCNPLADSKAAEMWRRLEGKYPAGVPQFERVQQSSRTYFLPKLQETYIAAPKANKESPAGCAPPGDSCGTLCKIRFQAKMQNRPVVSSMAFPPVRSSSSHEWVGWDAHTEVGQGTLQFWGNTSWNAGLEIAYRARWFAGGIQSEEGEYVLDDTRPGVPADVLLPARVAWEEICGGGQGSDMLDLIELPADEREERRELAELGLADALPFDRIDAGTTGCFGKYNEFQFYDVCGALRNRVIRVGVHSGLCKFLADMIYRYRLDSAGVYGAYRGSIDQMAARIANCETEGAILHEILWATSQDLECDPPTAPVGTSWHATGQAIDFLVQRGQPSVGWTDPDCPSSSEPGCADPPPVATVMQWTDPEWLWLALHSWRYGLYNLIGEPWHWSITGG